MCFSLSEGDKRVLCEGLVSVTPGGHHVVVKTCKKRKFHISLLANAHAVEDVTHYQFYFLL